VFEMDVLLAGEFRHPELATVMSREYWVTIRFSGARTLVIFDCVPPHVAGELIITAETSREPPGAQRLVVYKSIAGLEFELECERVSVVRVLPEDREAAG